MSAREQSAPHPSSRRRSTFARALPASPRNKAREALRPHRTARDRRLRPGELRVAPARSRPGGFLLRAPAPRNRHPRRLDRDGGNPQSTHRASNLRRPPRPLRRLGGEEGSSPKTPARSRDTSFIGSFPRASTRHRFPRGRAPPDLRPRDSPIDGHSRPPRHRRPNIGASRLVRRRQALSLVDYPFTARWPLAPGEHRFQVRLPHTEIVSNQVTVWIQ